MQTILAVDDDDEILMTIERELSNDYHIIAVNSGAMAFKYLNQKVPDLILLDILMPQMDGIEVLNKVRKNKEWKAVPVIFITSKKKTLKNEALLQAGVADYIEKPIKRSEIKNQIGEALQKMKVLEKNANGYMTLPTDCVMDDQTNTEKTVPGFIDHCEVNIPSEKIMMIHLKNNDYHIVTQHMEVISKFPLPILEKMLGNKFLRITPYIMINLKYVRLFVDGKVTMDNGKVITLPNKNKRELSQKIISEITQKIKNN